MYLFGYGDFVHTVWKILVVYTHTHTHVTASAFVGVWRTHRVTFDSYTNQELTTSWFMLLMNRATIKNLAKYAKGV